jgi:hypothetical protein
MDVSNVSKILLKNCNLSFSDYIYLLDHTQNLRTIYLQQLCNNPLFLDYQPENIKDLLRIIKTIAFDVILNCIKTNDTYRLILINLKINNMIASVQENIPVFKRALPNGVYSSEYINIYQNNEQKTVKEVIELYFNRNIKNNSNDNSDISNISNIYTKFLDQSRPILLENINNKKIEFSLLLFSILSTISLFEILG